MSLEEIDKQVRVCTKCSLYKTRQNAVPGEGNSKAEILFIGEAPGKREDELGKPFVGQAGEFLGELLSKIDLKKEDVFITNIVKCRPPLNRDPYPAEIQTCSPYLESQIKEINPRLIITLGRYSLAFFFPQKTISTSHGKLFKKELFIYPLFHPAAALHRNELKEIITSDFLKIPQVLEKIKQNENKTEQIELF